MTEEEVQEELRARARELKASLDKVRELHRRLPVSPQEGRHRDLDRQPDFATQVRSGLECLLHDCFEPGIQGLLDLASFMPGHGSAGGRAEGILAEGFAVDHNRANLDLSDFSEATRQALYDLVVWDNFTARPLDPQADHPDIWVPPYTPEEAELKIFHQHGRWFATWLRLDEPEDAPEEQRRELLRLEPHPQAAGSLVYTEV